MQKFHSVFRFAGLYCCTAFAFFTLFSSCQKPVPLGWDGTYCYRWKEEFRGNEQTIDFLNTCSGEHELLRVNTQGEQIYVQGPEGARAFNMISPVEGHTEIQHVDCNNQPFSIHYRVHQVGKSILLETSWTDGVDHLRRTSYTRMDQES